MDCIRCYVTELEDLHTMLLSPCLNQTTRDAIVSQCRQTLSLLIVASMELELNLLECVPRRREQRSEYSKEQEVPMQSLQLALNAKLPSASNATSAGSKKIEIEHK